MASSVTPASLLDSHLAGLVSRVPKLADPATVPQIQSAINEAIRGVERELGTRMDVTRFVPRIDAGPPVALDQTSGAQEYIDYLQWPGAIPGDGFPRFKAPIRPLCWVNSCVLYFPGALITKFTIPISWLRVSRQSHEITVAPTGGDTIYALAMASGGMGWRTPVTLALDFNAGLGDDGMDAWPQVDRLIGLRATIKLMPLVSAWFNPTALSSISADGLSQTRSSGYVFKDLEARLTEEADSLKRSILELWDGPAFLML